MGNAAISYADAPAGGSAREHAGMRHTHAWPAPDAEIEPTAPAAEPEAIADPLAGPEEIEPIERHARPCYRTYARPWQFADRLERGPEAPGLWLHGWKSGRKADDPGEPVDVRLGRPAWKVATLETAEERHFGLLVELVDLAGRRRVVPLDRGELVGDGRAALAELERCGAGIVDDRRYLKWLRAAPPERRLATVRRIGWTAGFRAFVLPDRTIGASDVLYAAIGSDADFAEAGDMARWREAAALAVGNPLMLVIVSTAFAAPLLGPLGLPSCGLHVVGSSGRVKTTPALVAAAAWGRGTEVGGYFRTWSGTINGIEALAVERNDAPLVLDEIGAGTASPEEVAALIYRLAGGVGRMRARRDGTAQKVKTWRTFALSTGEVGLEARLKEPLPPGAKGRFLELRVTGALVRERHGFASDRELAAHVRGLVAEHYGRAGPAFVARLLELGFDELRTRYADERRRFEGENSLEDRAANTFAALALAGELAGEWNIAPWPRGAVGEAVMEAWALWRSTAGAEADETKRAVEALRDFVERHGEARFSMAGEDREVRDRAGWWRTSESGSREWLFTGGGLAEALRGLDRDRATARLIEAGVIDAPPGRHRSYNLRIDGRRVRVYVVNDFALYADGGSSGSSGSITSNTLSELWNSASARGTTKPDAVVPVVPGRTTSGSDVGAGTALGTTGTTTDGRVVPAPAKPTHCNADAFRPGTTGTTGTTVSQRVKTRTPRTAAPEPIVDRLAEALAAGALDRARALFPEVLGREPRDRELWELACLGDRDRIRAELEALAEGPAAGAHA